MLRGLALQRIASDAGLQTFRAMQCLQLSDPGPNNLATFSFQNMPRSATCLFKHLL